jgi:transcriptional regulator
MKHYLRQIETTKVPAMYLRPAFVETDLERIAALIAANSFGTLVTCGPQGMDASHVPFTVRRDGEKLLLTAHLAAANAQCAALDGGTALAIFAGPHAYVSPSWYRTQPAVPTWDYAAVHVHGRLELVADETEVAAILKDLAEDDPGRFALDALPEKFRAVMLKGIRAFRLHPTRIEAQWKMSQNRSPEDRLGVIGALRAAGNQAVADLIAETLPPNPSSPGQSSENVPKVVA